MPSNPTIPSTFVRMRFPLLVFKSARFASQFVLPTVSTRGHHVKPGNRPDVPSPSKQTLRNSALREPIEPSA
jgi:hypothetical protein